LEEQQKNSYFDSENDVFETAIEFEYERKNFEASYNYAEGASARSLLDFLEKGKSSIKSAPENDYSYELKSKPLGLREIQKHMPEDVQILQYTVLDKKLLIWLVSKNQIVEKQFAISSENLQDSVEKYVESIKDEKRETSAENLRLSKEVYSILIEPIRADLDTNKQICIIPSKVLFFLPFSTLTSPQGKMFLEEITLFYSPSANMFVYCTKNAEKKSNQLSESILSIGNPAFDSGIFSDLENLRYAEKEAINIAGFYDKREIILGESATKNSFLKSFENVQVIHFAGHYLVKPNLPLDSSLLFAKNGDEVGDSLLTNRELLKANLKNLKLVVLSSCETGVETFLNGEGMIGLSRTFLAIDTPLVVASHWKADSEATDILMEKFHLFRREQHLSTAVALRKAQLEMLNETGFNTPYYWAAFSAFGGYSNF
jgi:CHAT domain-containing protein